MATINSNPATGSARWLRNDLESGNRVLQISVEVGRSVVRQAYEVIPVDGGFDLHTLDPKTFSPVCYHVDTTFGGDVWACNCPDATHRPQRQNCCKHVQALKKALEVRPY